MSTATTTVENTDHDLARDVAHATGLAITERTGDGAPVLAHAPSLEILETADGRDAAIFDLYLPYVAVPGDRIAELEILSAVMEELTTGVEARYRGAFVKVRHNGHRQILTVAVPRDAATRSVWERRASRRIVPAGLELES